MLKPDRAATWAKVEDLDPKSLPKCQLYEPPSNAHSGPAAAGTGAAGRGTEARMASQDESR